MLSFTELFRRDAIPKLVEQFGERDADGDLRVLAYFTPARGESQPYQWRGIASGVQIQELPNFDDGGIVRRETKNWRVERTLLDDDLVTAIARDGWYEDEDGVWEPDIEATAWGKTFVTLGMIRDPKVAGNELRSGAV